MSAGRRETHETNSRKRHRAFQILLELGSVVLPFWTSMIHISSADKLCMRYALLVDEPRVSRDKTKKFHGLPRTISGHRRAWRRHGGGSAIEAVPRWRLRHRGSDAAAGASQPRLQSRRQHPQLGLRERREVGQGGPGRSHFLIFF